MSLIICIVATGLTSTGLIWLALKLRKSSKTSDYESVIVREALNDGCIRVISGCFEEESRVEA